MKATIKQHEEKMSKVVSNLAAEFTTIRAGRPAVTVLDKVYADYYGSPTQITQMASVSIADGRTMVIKPYDKTALRGIEKAIQTSDIGFNPQNDGEVIRLTFPPITEDRRKELVKQIAKYGEEAKVAVRNVRRDAIDRIKALKKNGEITEDDQANGEKQIQNLTDKYTKEIDNTVAKKEKELLEV